MYLDTYSINRSIECENSENYLLFVQDKLTIHVYLWYVGNSIHVPLNGNICLYTKKASFSKRIRITNPFTYMYIYIIICTCTYMYTCTCTYTHMYMYIYVQYICTCTYMCTCTYIWHHLAKELGLPIHSHPFTYMYIYVYMYIYI